MFTIVGSTRTILGNAAVDLGLHDTYSVVAHAHVALSLAAIIAIFSGKVLMEKRLLVLRTDYFHPLVHFLLFIYIDNILAFAIPPMHFLGFNATPRRIPCFPDSFNSWNSLSSIGSGITFLSFGCFPPFIHFIAFTLVFVRYTHDSSCIREGNAVKRTGAKE